MESALFVGASISVLPPMNLRFDRNGFTIVALFIVTGPIVELSADRLKILLSLLPVRLGKHAVNSNAWELEGAVLPSGDVAPLRLDSARCEKHGLV